MATFYEFFAGGGMVRAGLGANWECLFANDFDPKKVTSYAANWGKERLIVGDVAKIDLRQLPDTADLAWASFPCQDLSLAGAGAGLKGERSGTFWPFWKLVKGLKAQGRAPRIVTLENVYGAITSHGGRDFGAIGAAFAAEGYRFGAIVIDAAKFLPQSRPRLFVIGVRDDIELPNLLVGQSPSPDWHPAALIEACMGLAQECRKNWIWWRLPTPSCQSNAFADLIEENPLDVEWHSLEKTQQLLAMMSPINLAKVAAAKKMRRRVVGTVYKRTRKDVNGSKVQRAEVRFDDIAGCLRTPAGGSSRQLIMMVEGAKVRSRLISSRETARLMGLPDSYALPTNYNEAYHLTGDGVAVPVVRFLADSLFEPLLLKNDPRTKAAA
ncbi:DNA cytosine methyltransferase [Rhodopseudomonas palustris]|nr:DNA cytosine methyltransferase [Rhodopseudomonas palustris]